MTHKIKEYFSFKRDEEDRTAFWCNPPNHPTRPGIQGVRYSDIVDIDQTGRYESCASRGRGHWFKGMPCREEGRPKRGEARFTANIAIDCSSGVFGAFFYKGGTTIDKFLVWTHLVLLPCITDRPRVITMDNLDASVNSSVLKAIREAGHIVVLRPIHSPDFGPVELVFAAVDKFMEMHDLAINKSNLDTYMRAAFDSIKAQDVMGYFAKCHFWVPGYKYKPYDGSQ
jgi:hypothetical protein